MSRRSVFLVVCITSLMATDRASADPILRYTFLGTNFQGSPDPMQVYATVDVPSAPATEAGGWSWSSATTPLLWRILTWYPGTPAPVWVQFDGFMNLGSVTGRGLDSGSNTFILGPIPKPPNVPAYSISMSSQPGRDELITSFDPHFPVIRRGDWLSPSALAAIPEPSPMVLGGVMTTAWALAHLRRRARSTPGRGSS